MTDQTTQPARDPDHPEMHPDRHGEPGMTELPTSGVPMDERTAGANAGSFEGVINPVIGADAVKTAGALLDVDALTGQDYVYTYEHALALPVLNKDQARPLQPLTDDQREKLFKSQADAGLAQREPILAFMNANRRTMLVAKGDAGLGVIVSEEV